MKNPTIPNRLMLEEDMIPKQWYNIRADMKKKPAPIVMPQTGKPATQQDIEPVLSKELDKQ